MLLRRNHPRLTLLVRFGGEAVSLAINHTQAAFFRAAPYRPLVLGQDHLGRLREYGNLSFVVVDDAGHYVTAEKPALALEIFRRAVSGLDIATGEKQSGNVTIPFPPDTPLSRATAGAAQATGGTSSVREDM
jgi:serine carboxypeptidase